METPFFLRFSLPFLTAAFLGWSAPSAFCNVAYWLPSSGDWSVGTNWSGGTTPGPNDWVSIENSGTVQMSTGHSETVGNLYVGHSGAGTLNIGGGVLTSNATYLGSEVGSFGKATITSGYWTINNTLFIGSTGGTGVLNIKGGTISSFACYIGFSSAITPSLSAGTATITDGIWNNTAWLYVGGTSGNGSLNINGGTVTNSYTHIGDSSNSVGVVTITSGTWNNTDDEFHVGHSGTGTLTIAGKGVLNIGGANGTLLLAYGGDSTGTLNFGDGASVGTLNASAGITIGGGTATINFNHAGNYTFGQSITGNTQKLSMNKLGSGTTTLTGNYQMNSVTISSGVMNANGTLKPSSPVNVASGATLSGSGTINGDVVVAGVLNGTLHAGAISGSGLVSPGNSPGVLTATSITPDQGISFAFEFTLANTNPIYAQAATSGNDILHLTSGSPFSGNLTQDNLVSIYLQSAIAGDTYLGGFFAGLTGAQLLAAIQNGTFAFFVADANGSVSFNGKTYSAANASLFSVETTNVTGANFADGTVNGSEMKIIVQSIPEPSTWGLLLLGIGVIFGFATNAERCASPQPFDPRQSHLEHFSSQKTTITQHPEACPYLKSKHSLMFTQRS